MGNYLKILVLSSVLLLSACGPKFEVGQKVFFKNTDCSGKVAEVIQFSEAVSYRVTEMFCFEGPFGDAVILQKHLRGSL